MRGFASVLSILVAVVACVSRDGDDRVAKSPAPESVSLIAAEVRSPPPDPEPVSLRVLVGGDVIPHRPSLVDAARVADALAPLASLFGAADAAIVNYESSTGDVARLPKRMGFAAEPAWMAALRDAHVTALTVANNHACDLGAAGLDATLHTAGRLGLTAIGADATDPWAPRVVAEKRGKKVCAVGWTTFANQDGCDVSLAVAAQRHGDAERIEAAVRRARDVGCDGVIAILHGGEEYAPQVTLPRRQARVAAEAGADAVVLHHPHVPSEIRTITTTDGRRVSVFLSLGNLVSNQGESWTPARRPTSADRHVVSMNAWTRLGVLADLVMTFDGGRGRRKAGWGYHLTWTENDHAALAHARAPQNAREPRIITRLVDPERDKALLHRLSTDDQGPVELFSGPCLLSVNPSHCN